MYMYYIYITCTCIYTHTPTHHTINIVDQAANGLCLKQASTVNKCNYYDNSVYILCEYFFILCTYNKQDS